jgi:DNA-binding transcriptional MerR regulator
VLQAAIERLRESGLSLDEIRRLFDAELQRQSGKSRARK